MELSKRERPVRDAPVPGCVGYFRSRSTETISARAARQDGALDLALI